MKKVSFLSVCLLIFQLAVFTPLLFGEDYTLEDLYRIALERSERIKVSEENINIAALGMNKAKATLIPRATAYGTFTKYSRELRSDTGSLNQAQEAGTWGLRLDQSMSLSGREFTALKIAGDNMEKSRYDLLSLQQDYMVTITAAFYDLLKAKKALEIANANLERLTKYRDAANTRLRVGEATKTALLRAEGELSGARSDKIKTANTLEAAKYSLARIVGIEGPFDIQESVEADMAVPASLTELHSQAMAHRIELKSFELQKKIAEQQVNYAKGSLWPNLSMSAVYARNDEFPQRSSLNRESINANVALNFPFYEGGLRKAEVMEAETKLRQAELLYKDAVKSLTLEVGNSYLDVVTQQGIIRFLKDQLTYAQDNFAGVSKQYEFGLANSIDVLDANNLLLSAQRQLSDAIYNNLFSLLKLKKATGALLEEVTAMKNEKM